MNVKDFAKFLFDRPADSLEWYFMEDYEEPQLEKAQIVDLSATIFRDIGMFANEFNERQLCLGLRYLINASCSSSVYSFIDPELPFENRAKVISNMFSVFNEVFAKRCHQQTTFSDLEDSLPFTYAETCYMWWDIFPRHGSPRSLVMTETDEKILETIEKVLGIENFACKESGLHGLGHWYGARPEEVDGILERVLPRIPSELIAYAGEASKGNVQ